MDSFYKNLSIMGGFLLLYITGPGKYSIDALFAASPRDNLRCNVTSLSRMSGDGHLIDELIDSYPHEA